MEKKKMSKLLWLFMLGVFLYSPQLVVAKETIQEWEFIKPEGVVEIKPVAPAPRLSSLEGKTVALRWNGKHNGDNFLDRIAELFKEKMPSVKVVKLYEVDQTTIKISGSAQESARIAKVIKNLKADIVIGAQTD